MWNSLGPPGPRACLCPGIVTVKNSPPEYLSPPPTQAPQRHWSPAPSSLPGIRQPLRNWTEHKTEGRVTACVREMKHWDSGFPDIVPMLLRRKSTWQGFAFSIRWTTFCFTKSHNTLFPVGLICEEGEGHRSLYIFVKICQNLKLPAYYTQLGSYCCSNWQDKRWTLWQSVRPEEAQMQICFPSYMNRRETLW